MRKARNNVRKSELQQQKVKREHQEKLKQTSAIWCNLPYQ